MKFKLENMVYLKHHEQKRACLWEVAEEGAGDEEAKRKEPQWPSPNSADMRPCLLQW